MKTPVADDLRFAAEWLRMYDDSHDGGAQSAVAEEVATWLEEQADLKQLRDVARENGVPVEKLRKKLRATAEPAPSAHPGTVPVNPMPRRPGQGPTCTN